MLLEEGTEEAIEKDLLESASMSPVPSSCSSLLHASLCLVQGKVSVAMHMYRRIPTAHCPMKCGGAMRDTHFLVPPVVWQCRLGFRFSNFQCGPLTSG